MPERSEFVMTQRASPVALLWLNQYDGRVCPTKEAVVYLICFRVFRRPETGFVSAYIRGCQKRLLVDSRFPASKAC